MTISTPDRSTRLWERFEQAFTSPIRYENPLQDAWLTVTFVAPSGRSVTVDGFWDGGATWRVRFMADEEGVWAYTTSCTDIGNPGLHDLYGEFLCTPPDSTWRFGSHGPVRIGENRRHFAHADGTPFFWLADTAWNGPMHATPAEWQHYLQVRLLQGFNTVQWVTMQYLGSPHGSADGEMAFSGHDRVAVNAAFFRRLDDRLDAINRAGMLAAPALLWSAHWSIDAVNALNPGLVLPEDQCILLARYQIARWGAHHVVWMLSGDANYLGENAPRWQRIGRTLFGDRPARAGDAPSMRAHLVCDGVRRRRVARLHRLPELPLQRIRLDALDCEWRARHAVGERAAPPCAQHRAELRVPSGPERPGPAL